MLIGLVGAPSAGKSSFFSAATLIDVGIASYAFTTIEPNHGFASVRIECVCQKDFGKQCNPRTGVCDGVHRQVPVELMDVAGLVPNAHKGEGRGNEFLSDLSRADVLVHIIDVSGGTNQKGEMVSNHNPSETVQFLEDEIGYWFLGIIKRNWDKIAKVPLRGKNHLLQLMAQNLSGIGVNEHHLNAALSACALTEKKLQTWTDEDKKAFAFKLRETSKPIVIAANKVDLENGKKNVDKLKKEFPGRIIIGCSAQSELALKKAAKQGLIAYTPGEKSFTLKEGMSEKQQEALTFIQKNVLDVFDSTGVQTVLETTVFDVLQYMAIFPGGVKKLEDSEGRVLPDCFLMPPNSTALDFAFKLHTDFGKNFIRAIDVKTKKMVGKEHALKHRDVLEIVANA